MRDIHTLMAEGGGKFSRRPKDKPPQVEPPGMLRRISNFAKASARHLAAGAPQASDETVAERWAACQSCRLFKRTGDDAGLCTHGSCGCNVKQVGLAGLNKLRWADSVCPLGKWEAEPRP